MTLEVIAADLLAEPRASMWSIIGPRRTVCRSTSGMPPVPLPEPSRTAGNGPGPAGLRTAIMAAVPLTLAPVQSLEA